ncbi:hypothetical protein D9M68_404910 [compost metagenome]
MRVHRQRCAGHEDRAAVHGVACDHVLADSLFQEALRRDDAHLACLDVVLADNAADAAVVISVRVADHDRHDGTLAEVLCHKLIGGAGRFGRRHGVEHNPAGVALDERHVGHAEASHLVDAVGDLEQPIVAQELGIAPEARIDGVRGRLAVHLGSDGGEAGPEIAVGAAQLGQVRGRDQAALRIFEVLLVLKR